MTRLREVVVRAERIGGHSRRPKRYSQGRTCALCDTILSVFNKGERCSVHESPHFSKYRAKKRSA